ncbi:DUF1127 domain-containing protein [Yersinia massiliensis]|jgi:uncharacterized protein YjiS (DUF1127 family)|uniref:DUF1127 domain-containing protein n=3 Tax=Yersinia TaxID=629 RepID=A0A0T9P094_9GAMM|nr:MULTISPECIES: DUF1127 domain-containing protein [Yersinia]HEC1649122.1 DUF1127 domain-containing protein [Yersinia enterocolitica]ATM88363.1 DUF1127 domain-containing protein [Yersinia frederiksenii]AVX39867.1 DUF1127 domain-containing protein [Yersinia massiliensis]MCB5316977.1 DUF1127 domain-containing protein [Yersinia massiliensis]MDA5549047.1 DUF1127 domain-containing protein [Yersinia massiliensis]
MNNIIEDQIDECCSSAMRAKQSRRNIFIRLWLKAYRYTCRWNELRKTANTMARLNPAQLKDIGLTREDIKRDYSRPFWR